MLISITTSTNYQISTSQKFLELKNLTDNPKVFKPAPLNSLNSLTLKIKDNLGNILDYRNQYLNLKNITFIPSEIGATLSTIDDGTNYELTLNLEGEINTINVINDYNNYLLNEIKTSVDNLNITDLTTTVNQNKLNINHANKKFNLIPVISNQINIECMSSTIKILNLNDNTTYTLDIDGSTSAISYTLEYLDIILTELETKFINTDVTLSVTKQSPFIILEHSSSNLLVEPITSSKYSLKFNNFDLSVTDVQDGFNYSMDIISNEITQAVSYTTNFNNIIIDNLVSILVNLNMNNLIVNNLNNTLDIEYPSTSNYVLSEFSLSPINSNLFDIKHKIINLSLNDNQLFDGQKYGFIIKDSNDIEYTITSEDVSYSESFFNDFERSFSILNIYDLSFSDYGSDNNNLPYATLSTDDIKTFESEQNENSNDYFDIFTIKAEFLHFEDNNNDSDFDFKFAIYDSNCSHVGGSISITGTSISNLVTVINNNSNLNQYIIASQDYVNFPTKLIVERIGNYYYKIEETDSFSYGRDISLEYVYSQLKAVFKLNYFTEDTRPEFKIYFMYDSQTGTLRASRTVKIFYNINYRKYINDKVQEKFYDEKSNNNVPSNLNLVSYNNGFLSLFYDSYSENFTILPNSNSSQDFTLTYPHVNLQLNTNLISNSTDYSLDLLIGSNTTNVPYTTNFNSDILSGIESSILNINENDIKVFIRDNIISNLESLFSSVESTITNNTQFYISLSKPNKLRFPNLILDSSNYPTKFEIFYNNYYEIKFYEDGLGGSQYNDETYYYYFFEIKDWKKNYGLEIELSDDDFVTNTTYNLNYTSNIESLYTGDLNVTNNNSKITLENPNNNFNITLTSEKLALTYKTAEIKVLSSEVENNVDYGINFSINGIVNNIVYETNFINNVLNNIKTQAESLGFL